MSSFLCTSSNDQKSFCNYENVLPSFMNYKPKNDPLFNQNNFDIEIMKNYFFIEKCPICLNQIKKYIKLNNCEHIFCNKCLLKWLNYSKNCPICRRSIK